MTGPAAHAGNGHQAHGPDTESLTPPEGTTGPTNGTRPVDGTEERPGQGA